ncbi:MAG: signal peptidase I [Chloroflexota bacterium]
MTENESATPIAKRRRASWPREVLETALLTLAIFLVVRVALQNFRVEGTSMVPNLHNGEYILVNKLGYRFRSPSRGDVIVFNAVPAGEPGKDFIKRIVGLPGDLVQVTSKTVYINHRPLRERYIGPLYRATYAFGPLRVPRNSYFVLGDNRNNSFDSSRWPVSWLPRNDIIGEAWISYWPLRDLSFFQTPSF